MIHRAALLSLATLLCTLASAAEPAYKPELFQRVELVHEDLFDKGPLNTAFWEVRQGSTWEVKDGVLHGSPAPKEYQDKKIAANDRAHAGLKPVMWLKQLPENFVCTMRVRYDGKDYMRGFPLLDVGHHIHTLTFSAKATTLTIKKDVQKVEVPAPLFSLNTWHDVAIELKKGTLLLSIDGVKHRFESPNIDMTGHSQIDFKALDHGTCQIDNVRIWKGL